MTDAFLPLLDPAQGRIANVGSGAGGMFMKATDEDTNRFLSTQDITWEQLEEKVKEIQAKDPEKKQYGLSKAALSKYTAICAK